jgi:hypothetical protein
MQAYVLGNAIVAAKSRMSDKSSNPKIALNSLIAFLFLAATSESNLSTIALMLATQSCGPSLWIGSYLEKSIFVSQRHSQGHDSLPLWVL